MVVDNPLWRSVGSEGNSSFGAVANRFGQLPGSSEIGFKVNPLYSEERLPEKAEGGSDSCSQELQPRVLDFGQVEDGQGGAPLLFQWDSMEGLLGRLRSPRWDGTKGLEFRRLVMFRLELVQPVYPAGEH